MSYQVIINDQEYNDPSKYFTVKLGYDSTYSGQLKAIYPDGEHAIVSFDFTTPKSQILFIVDYGILRAIDLYTKNVIWEHLDLLNSPSHGSPIVYENKIIIGKNKLTALDIFTGEVVWENNMESIINFKTPFLWATMGNTMYIPGYYTYFDEVYSLDMDDGTLNWNRHMGGGRLNIGEFIYLGFDAYDWAGRFLWRAKFDPAKCYPGGANQITSPPLLHKNNLYFGDVKAVIYSVNALTGVKNWSISLDCVGHDVSRGGPAIYENNIIFPIKKKLYSINSTTSEINWINYSSSDLIYSVPFVYESIILITSSSESYVKGEILAIDAINGGMLWRVNIPSRIKSSPILFQDKVFVGSQSEFYELDAATGEITWFYSAGSPSHISPVIVVGDSEVIIYSGDTRTIEFP